MLKSLLIFFMVLCQGMFSPHPCESLQTQESVEVTQSATSHDCHTSSEATSESHQEHEQNCIHCAQHCHPVALYVLPHDWVHSVQVSRLSFIFVLQDEISSIALIDRPPMTSLS